MPAEALNLKAWEVTEGSKQGSDMNEPAFPVRGCSREGGGEI